MVAVAPSTGIVDASVVDVAEQCDPHHELSEQRRGPKDGAVGLRRTRDGDASRGREGSSGAGGG